METKEFKRGDTFALTCTRRNAAGVAMNITSTTIASKMRLGAAEVTLTVTPTIPASGVFVLSATPAATQAWTAGLWRCDVQFTDAGDVRSTQTFLVSVVEDVTF
jgi:hypothetical protein